MINFIKMVLKNIKQVLKTFIKEHIVDEYPYKDEM